jgi:hypothetical protein
MTAAVETAKIAWWREPTKQQWYAWWSAWLGWTLDQFDFTAFLLIIAPIAQEFHVPLTEAAFILTVTLWMRLFGATAAGWLSDRVGRKVPLMISIVGFSLCNFIAGFSPTFAFLFFFRALATGQADDRAPAEEESPASNFAKKGGKARAAKLSAKRGVRGVKDTRFHSHFVQRPSKSKSAQVTADRRFQGHRNSGLPVLCSPQPCW